MYQLLIVDDEVYSVMGIESGVDFKKIGISSVFKAYNIRQAKKILEDHPIDLLLTDIEMPQGSGLELLEWAKARNPDIEAVMLSGHTDFSYAQKALQLGSADYVLKSLPYAELEKAVGRAVAKIEQNRRLNRYSELWNKNKVHQIRQFWQDLLTDTIEADGRQIREAAANRGIHLQESEKFVPVLFQTRPECGPQGAEAGTAQAEIKRYLCRRIAGCTADGSLVTYDEHNFLALFAVEREQRGTAADVQAGARRLASEFNDTFREELYCCIGYPTEIEKIPKQVSRLYELEKNNVMAKELVWLSTEEQAPRRGICAFDDKIWLALLRNRQYGCLLRETEAYLDVVAEELDAGTLQQFQVRFLHLLYLFTEEEGGGTAGFMSDEASLVLYEQAKDSLCATKRWIRHIVGNLQAASDGETAASVIEKAKRYIEANIDKNFGRDDVAKHVHLNPDYLSRLFKKEVGSTISEYTQLTRVRIAKELLEKTNLSVGNVAAKLGYSNFAHFSRMFKENIGMSPALYKNSCRKAAPGCL